MRFLLNTVGKSSKAIRRESRKLAIKKCAEVSSATSTTNDTVSYNKSWGQQCSPSCGCVVRFETNIDPSTQTIVNSTYQAKSIVSIHKNGRLEPIRTTTTKKPMLKECKCTTLHTLAQEITAYVTDKNLDYVRNLSEFAFTRSSPAFRHAVLVDNQLPRTDTHCFDVVEEAYTAMLKGFLPRQRKNMSSFDKILAADFVWTTVPTGDEDEILAPTPRREEAMNVSRLSLSSPRSVSALSMFDINAEYWENEEHQRAEEEERQEMSRSLDWLSFVDEQSRSQESA